MNKGIPYLMAALVALTLSAGWAAPVLALFNQVATCLGQGGSLDVLHLQCVPPGMPREGMLGGWVFWLTAASVVVVALVATRTRPQRRRRFAPQ